MGIVFGLIGILLVIGVVVLVLLGLWIFSARRDRRERIRRQGASFCGECEHENEGAAVFCAKCGSQRLVDLREHQQLEEERAKWEGEEIRQAARRNAAISRIRELCDRSYCAQCERVAVAGTKFCTQCGANIEVSICPDEEMFAKVQKEFPDVVGSMQCFQSLRDENPEEGVKRRGWRHALDHVVRAAKRAGSGSV